MGAVLLAAFRMPLAVIEGSGPLDDAWTVTARVTGLFDAPPELTCMLPAFAPGLSRVGSITALKVPGVVPLTFCTESH